MKKRHKNSFQDLFDIELSDEETDDDVSEGDESEPENGEKKQQKNCQSLTELHFCYGQYSTHGSVGGIFKNYIFES